MGFTSLIHFSISIGDRNILLFSSDDSPLMALMKLAITSTYLEVHDLAPLVLRVHNPLGTLLVASIILHFKTVLVFTVYSSLYIGKVRVKERRFPPVTFREPGRERQVDSGLWGTVLPWHISFCKKRN